MVADDGRNCLQNVVSSKMYQKIQGLSISASHVKLVVQIRQ